MRNRLLKPWSDFSNRLDILLCHKAVHFVSKTNADAAVPKPANRYVDFAIIDPLEFGREIVAVALVASFHKVSVSFFLWRFSRLTFLPRRRFSRDFSRL